VNLNCPPEVKFSGSMIVSSLEVERFDSVVLVDVESGRLCQ
jgi:hypothetical protein